MFGVAAPGVSLALGTPPEPGGLAKHTVRTPDATITSRVTKSGLCRPTTAICSNRVQFGFVGVTLADGLSQIPKLSSAVNHTPTLVGWYQDFSEPLNSSAIAKYIKTGQTPIITWEPQKVGDRIPDNYPLRDIADGKFDSYLIRSAIQAKSVGGQFVMRFAHEMNGYWYPWGQPKPNDPRSYATRTNTPDDYIAAYRHIHDVFGIQGVKNVYWMWSPNLIDATPNIALSSLYPGDEYVDVVGLSGYLHGTDQSYSNKYVPTLNELDEVAPTKPIIIAEGAVDHNANRLKLVTDLLTKVSHTPRVKGFLWLNKKSVAYDYTVGSDPDVLDVIRRALTKPPFAKVAGSLQSIAEIPTIQGNPIVGNTLSAQASYRGTARTNRFSWFLCESATEPPTDCRVVGQGAYHLVVLSERHKYLRVRFMTSSTRGYDSAMSAASGPVLTVPDTPALPSVNLRGTSTQLQFAPVPAGTTHIILRIDGGAPIYLPAATKDYWINGLILSSEHTFALSHADIFGTTRSEGDIVSSTFAAMASSSNPTATLTSKTVTLNFPSIATGQTGWEYYIDGGEYEPVAVLDTKVVIDLLPAGTHTAGIRRVSGDGRTLPKIVSFVVQSSPTVTAVNLRGTSTQLTFATPPSGATHLVIRLDDRDAVYLPISIANEYWITGLTKGQTYHVSLTYKYSITGFTGEGWRRDLSFVALSTPPGPDFRIDSDALTVYLPEPTLGQTGWRYSLDDSAQVTLDAVAHIFSLPSLSAGNHQLTIRALGGAGETLAYPVSFSIP
mgnify:CR=1 FL=1